MKVKNLGASPRGIKRKIAFSIFEASLRDIKPVFTAEKARLVQLAALNLLQNNYTICSLKSY